MPRLDLDTLGHRIRHFRTAHDRTLDQLGAAVGLAASQLSLIENGKGEPKLSTLENIATALDIELSDLLAQEAPSKRAELEVALARAQAGPLFRSLGIPPIKPTPSPSNLLSVSTKTCSVGRRRRSQHPRKHVARTPICANECDQKTTTSTTSNNSPRNEYRLPGTGLGRSPTAKLTSWPSSWDSGSSTLTIFPVPLGPSPTWPVAASTCRPPRSPVDTVFVP